MWSYTVTRCLLKGSVALLQMSMDAIYETLVAPQGGPAPSTPKRGARLVRFASTPPGVRHLCAAGCELLSQLLLLPCSVSMAACHWHRSILSAYPPCGVPPALVLTVDACCNQALPPRARPPARGLVRANSMPQPWSREPKQRSGGAAAPAAAGPPPQPLRRTSQAIDVAAPSPPASPGGAFRRNSLPASAAGSPLAGRRSASGGLGGSTALSSCLRASSSPIAGTPPASPQRAKQPQAGGGAGTSPSSSPLQDRHRRHHSASSLAGSSCTSPRSHAIGGYSRRANRCDLPDIPTMLMLSLGIYTVCPMAHDVHCFACLEVISAVRTPGP